MRDEIKGIVIWDEDYDWLALEIGQRLEARPPAM